MPDTSTDPHDPLVLPSPSTTPAELAEAQHHVIEDQIGERSLARQQKELRIIAEKAQEKSDANNLELEDGGSVVSGEPESIQETALLNNDDDELTRVESVSLVRRLVFCQHVVRQFVLKPLIRVILNVFLFRRFCAKCTPGITPHMIGFSRNKHKASG